MASLASDYLHLAQQAIDLIGSPAVAQHWAAPSALAGYDVAGLAGHLGRGLATVAAYLDQPAPPGAQLVDATEYYVLALADHDPVDSDMHRNVRTRSAELAAHGPTGLADSLHSTLVAVAPRLHALPDDFAIVAFGNLALPLHQYLITRVVELAVHLDDLAVSVATVAPPVPDGAAAHIVATLAEVARRRRGNLAVIRLLARHERAGSDATAF